MDFLFQRDGRLVKIKNGAGQTPAESTNNKRLRRTLLVRRRGGRQAWGWP